MRCRVNVLNCHLDNDTGNLVTEPLSRNGRLLRFRYNPAFSGTPKYIIPEVVCLNSCNTVVIQYLVIEGLFSNFVMISEFTKLQSVKWIPYLIMSGVEYEFPVVANFTLLSKYSSGCYIIIALDKI
jgi:hypothetical protein